jgi:cytochrome P450
MGVPQSDWTLSNFLGYLDGLRDRGAVHFDEKIQAWHVLGYQDTLQVLTDPVTFSSDVNPLAPKQEDLDLSKKGNFLRADDPVHRRLRGLVGQVFTQRMITGLESRVVEVATQLFDDADARGGDRWDLVEEVAYPLPFIVVAEMLGIPVTDRAFVRKLSDTFFQARNVDPASSADSPGESALDKVGVLLRELNEYLLEFVRSRRKNPVDDLTSKLLTAELDGVRPDDEETVGFLHLLLAGHVTTTSALGNTVLALNENPDAWARLRAAPALVPAAIEESVRFRPPFARVGRRVTRDTEIGGQKIPADSFIRLWLAAANRDDSVFADPDRFDINRSPNPHVGFGRGIHFCLGVPLARLELKTAIGLMLERYSEVRVRDDAPVKLRNPWVMMGVSSLPVEVRKY